MRLPVLVALLGVPLLAQTAPPPKLKLFHLPSFQVTVQDPAPERQLPQWEGARITLRKMMESQAASVCAIPLTNVQPKDTHDAMTVAPSRATIPMREFKVPAPSCDDKK